MASIVALHASLTADLTGKSVIITGAANGICLETALQYYANGANIAIADLASSQNSAEETIRRLDDPSRALFVPVDITRRDDMGGLFAKTVERFGRVDIVVANAGIMESRRFFDFDVDEKGELKDDGFGRVIDVNLKGTMNTLKHAVFRMKDNPPDQDGWRGSVVLVASTSGYFGGTEVISYVSSKHGVIGLLRSSHGPAESLGIRVNAVAPLTTPTFMTSGFSAAWEEEGLPTNTPAAVAAGILQMSLDTHMRGKCCLIVGGTYREIEGPLAKTSYSWTGEAIDDLFLKVGNFFRKLGGYPLPPRRYIGQSGC
ncbi:hypothetical protein B0T10DRAFT_559220 [Thelonectria olida]|uniref:Uncharacterized protein n=1 Tax=Thelonectria olida TaxID=1576542 RepID=A0A9P9ASU7_9HYPO|nr:hypothetical protein B0T10DRAFT_559220 [Thelonectria olida]